MTDNAPGPAEFDLDGLVIPAADTTPDPEGPTDEPDAGPGDAGAVDLAAGDGLADDPELDPELDPTGEGATS